MHAFSACSFYFWKNFQLEDTRALELQSQFLFLFELIHYEELVLNVSTGYAHNLPEVFLLNHKVICKEFVRQ